MFTDIYDDLLLVSKKVLLLYEYSSISDFDYLCDYLDLGVIIEDEEIKELMKNYSEIISHNVYFDDDNSVALYNPVEKCFIEMDDSGIYEIKQLLEKIKKISSYFNINAYTMINSLNSKLEEYYDSYEPDYDNEDRSSIDGMVERDSEEIESMFNSLFEKNVDS